MGSITKKTASDKIFSVTSRVRRGTPKSAIEKKNFQAGVDTVTGVKAARAEKVVKVAKKRAMKEEQDRKDEENNKCDQLFKMRTAKKKRIWGERLINLSIVMHLWLKKMELLISDRKGKRLTACIFRISVRVHHPEVACPESARK